MEGACSYDKASCETLTASQGHKMQMVFKPVCVWALVMKQEGLAVASIARDIPSSRHAP